MITFDVFLKYMCWKKILDKCRPSAQRVSCSRARPRDQEPPHSLETWDVQMASDDIRWPQQNVKNLAVKHGRTSWSMVKPIVKPTDHDPQIGGWTNYGELIRLPLFDSCCRSRLASDPPMGHGHVDARKLQEELIAKAELELQIQWCTTGLLSRIIAKNQQSKAWLKRTYSNYMWKKMPIVLLVSINRKRIYTWYMMGFPHLGWPAGGS